MAEAVGMDAESADDLMARVQKVRRPYWVVL